MNKKIREAAERAVGDLVAMREFLEQDQEEVSPSALWHRLLEEAGNQKAPSPAQGSTLQTCLRSYEGLAYFITMEARQSLGALPPLRWWGYCRIVDELVVRNGFPPQDGETRRAVFQALEILQGCPDFS